VRGLLTRIHRSILSDANAKRKQRLLSPAKDSLPVLLQHTTPALSNRHLCIRDHQLILQNPEELPKLQSPLFLQSATLISTLWQTHSFAPAGIEDLPLLCMAHAAEHDARVVPAEAKGVGQSDVDLQCSAYHAEMKMMQGCLNLC
jgi:hypothetical protein